MSNWSKLCENPALPIIKQFASGKISGAGVARAFKNTEFAGAFRHIVRTHGVDKAKVNARKALRRREIPIV